MKKEEIEQEKERGGGEGEERKYLSYVKISIVQK